MILTILGGSAQSTPVLAATLAEVAPDAQIELRLAGRDPRRLAAVQRACRLMTRGSGIRVETAGEGVWADALCDSDVVLVQTRIGGYAARAFDESFPLSFGIPGDEGLGPGGLSAAYRSWPAMRALLEEIQLCAPGAETILLSSPSSLLLRMAAAVFPGWRIKGTCELPWTTMRSLCERFGEDATTFAFGYVGVNHLGFLYDVRGTVDLLEAYLRKAAGDSFPSPALVRSLRALPLKYLRLHYQRPAVVREQAALATPRAQQLSALAEQAFSVFLEGDEAAVRHALTLRTADWYPYAVVPLLLAALGRPVAQPVFLSMADAEGEVRERGYRWQGDAWRPMAHDGAPPPDAAELVEEFAAYERDAARAVLEGTVAALTEALGQHPWVRTADAPKIASSIVNQPVCPAALKESVACLS